MPTIKVYKDDLEAALGASYTDEEFDHLCFEFGIELDDVTSDKEIVQKAKGEDADLEGLSDRVVYKIDVPANRYDLLCLEGISRSLRIFLGKEETPVYKLLTPSDEKIITMTQKPATKTVREFVVGAVLRNVTFNETNYASFMDLQDKLHQNIGRARTLIAIGTHDLDTLAPPFVYDAKPQKDIVFQPLAEEKEFSVDKLFHYYKNEKPNCHLKPYVGITENSPVHPVIYDSKETVLSLPPIINGDHSKIKLSTKNVFIECTGTDKTKLHIVLNIVVSAFAQYCSTPFEIERVKVVDEESNTSTLLPIMDDIEFKADVGYITKMTGIPESEVDGDKMASILGKMSLPSTHKDGIITVNVPVTRPDILHMCDIAEDVAIAYGYNKLKKTIPNVMTIGAEQPVNQLSDLNRSVMAECGYSEVLTWILTSHNDNFLNLNQPKSLANAVILANPKTVDFQEIRTSLLSGLCKVARNNIGHSTLPIRIFECGDIVVLDNKKDVGARNNRRVAALHMGANTSGFEEIWSCVDRVMAQNSCSFVSADSKEAQAALSSPLVAGVGVKNIYFIKPSKNPTYFDGRRADVYFNGIHIGGFGVVHPIVLNHYGITFPCSAFELDLEAML